MEDRYKFVMDAASELRKGNVAAVDLAAVAEELEQVGRSDAHEVRNRTERLLEHMIKLEYITGIMLEQNERLWLKTLDEQRDQISDLLEESPSLRTKLTPELLARSYKRGAKAVLTEYGFTAPAECPWTWEECL